MQRLLLPFLLLALFLLALGDVAQGVHVLVGCDATTATCGEWSGTVERDGEVIWFTPDCEGGTVSVSSDTTGLEAQGCEARRRD